MHHRFSAVFCDISTTKVVLSMGHEVFTTIVLITSVHRLLKILGSQHLKVFSSIAQLVKSAAFSDAANINVLIAI